MSAGSEVALSRDEDMLRKWDLIVDANGQMRTTRDVLRQFFLTSVLLPYRARKERRRRAVERMLEREAASRTAILNEYHHDHLCIYRQIIKDVERIQRAQMTAMCYVWWVGVLWLSERYEWSLMMNACLYTNHAHLGTATCAEHVLFAQELAGRQEVLRLEYHSTLCGKTGLSMGCAIAVQLDEPQGRAALLEEELDTRRRLWNKFNRSTRIAWAQWLEFEEFMARQLLEKNVDQYFERKRLLMATSVQSSTM